MKKTTISIIILLFLSANVFSQAYKENRLLRLGLKASPNLGWLRPETKDFENDGVKMGFSYGLISDFRISDNYYVSSGLFITHWSGRLNMPATEEIDEIDDDDIADFTQSRLYKLQYLEIPLTLKLLTNEIGYITYFGQFGVSVAANIDADGEDTYVAEGETDIVIDDPDIKSDITFMRAALVIGGGLEYSLAENASIVIGAEYNNGFSNLIKSKPEHASKHSALTNYFQLTLGVIF